jgi:hypothetical protein
MVAIRPLIIAAWLFMAIYAGVAGWVASKAFENTGVQSQADQFVEYEGLSFENKQSLQEFLHDSEGARLFPWIFAIPQELTPLVTSFAFGLLGGVIALLKKIAIDHSPVSTLPIIAGPLFGSLVGVMLFFISFLVPAIFIVGRTPPRTEALVGVSLFGGAFSERAFVWIEEEVRKLFSSRTRRGSQTPARKG